MDAIILSESKTDELIKEKENLESDIKKHDEQTASEGTMAYSFKDAATEEIAVQTKRKRLKELKRILKKVKLIKKVENPQSVLLGNDVTLTYENGKRKTFTIVHPLEADPIQNKISDESKIGSILQDKSIGDNVILPSGTTATITEIK